MTNRSKPSKPTNDQWTAPNPIKATPPKTYSEKLDDSAMREEDMVPLQVFEGVGRSEHFEREVEGRKWSESPEFKPGLHLHGDLSTSRPGHLKRWDSEARIGGGHGVEEIEDRI